MADTCSLCDQPLTVPVPYLGRLSTLLAQMGTKRWHYGCVWRLGGSLRG